VVQFLNLLLSQEFYLHIQGSYLIPKDKTHNKQEVKIIKIIPEKLMSEYKGSSNFFSAGMTIEEHVGQCKTRTK
jgi:hypothetical protein